LWDGRCVIATERGMGKGVVENKEGRGGEEVHGSS